MADSCSVSNNLSPILGEVCLNIQRFTALYDSNQDPRNLDILVYQVSKLYRILLAYDGCTEDVLEAVGICLRVLEEKNDTQELSVVGYVAQPLFTGRRGRPRLDISREQLEYLLHLGFSCPQVALVMGVSLSTVRRRMSEYGLSITALYSTISDEELDMLIMQIKESFPNSGYRLMQAHLCREGHRVTQSRVRDAMWRVDPEGSTLRWAQAIQRRKYSVTGPLALWHLDGNHKLIR